MRPHILSDPTHYAWREAPMRLRRRHARKRTDHVQPRARVQSDACCVAPGGERSVRRRHERRTTVIAAGDHQARGNIGTLLASKELEISFEYRPEADAGL